MYIIMFYEFILSNNSSFEPQHYLEDSYIPIIAWYIYPETLWVAIIEVSFSQYSFC